MQSAELFQTASKAAPRVAVVHDWLYTLGGAEKVLHSILNCFPGADLYTLFDVAPPAVKARIGYATARTSFLQHMPRIRRNHRHYLPLMPLAIEQLDMSRYDIVISSSCAVAKSVITGPDQLHVSYVHSPMRYAWDLQHQYLRESRMDRGLKGLLARLLLHRLRVWDVRTAHGVDSYICNSHFVARRVRKLYGKQATVIHPPVDVPDVFTPVRKESFFFTASRLVQYKNVRVIVEAFNKMPDQRLRVVGSGPELSALKALAGPNVEMLGFVEDAPMRRMMAEARAFVFAAEEDFGIVPVEAQAMGTPVIALGRGGALETVIADSAAPTGLFFDEAQADSIVDAVRRFIGDEGLFLPRHCHANAARFSRQRFEADLSARIAADYRAHRAGILACRAAPLPPEIMRLASSF